MVRAVSSQVLLPSLLFREVCVDAHWGDPSHFCPKIYRRHHQNPSLLPETVQRKWRGLEKKSSVLQGQGSWSVQGLTIGNVCEPRADAKVRRPHFGTRATNVVVVEFPRRRGSAGPPTHPFKLGDAPAGVSTRPTKGCPWSRLRMG